MNRSLKIGAVILFILFLLLINIAFFSVNVTHNEVLYNKVDNKIEEIYKKLDSLELIISSYNNKKDTTIIHIVPQKINIYHTKKT